MAAGHSAVHFLTLQDHEGMTNDLDTDISWGLPTTTERKKWPVRAPAQILTFPIFHLFPKVEYHTFVSSEKMNQLIL